MTQTDAVAARPVIDVLAWSLISGMQDAGDPVDVALRAANVAGRDWQWADASDALIRAYLAAGCVAGNVPEIAHGYLWHRGQHPIQIRARALCEEQGV